MLMMKKWSQIRSLYIDSNKVIGYQQLKLVGRKRDFAPALSALLLMSGIALTLHAFSNPLWPVLVMTGISLCMLIFFLSADRLMAKLYRAEYERHDIAQQGFWERADFVAYARFLDGVEKAKYNPAQLEAIAQYSETLGPAPKPFLIHQHFLALILTSINVNLLSAFLLKTDAWAAHQGIVVMWASLSLLVIAFLVLDGLRSPKIRDARIRRYLRRAKIELEQLASTQGNIVAEGIDVLPATP
jgi:hypothetical protein